MLATDIQMEIWIDREVSRSRPSLQSVTPPRAIGKMQHSTCSLEKRWWRSHYICIHTLHLFSVCLIFTYFPPLVYVFWIWEWVQRQRQIVTTTPCTSTTTEIKVERTGHTKHELNSDNHPKQDNAVEPLDDYPNLPKNQNVLEALVYELRVCVCVCVKYGRGIEEFRCCHLTSLFPENSIIKDY